MLGLFRHTARPGFYGIQLESSVSAVRWSEIGLGPGWLDTIPSQQICLSVFEQKGCITVLWANLTSDLL